MTKQEAMEALSVMSDLISRHEALKGYQSVCKDIACHECKAKEVDGTCRLESFINNLPSTDRPTGHWIEHDDERVLCECSECHEKYLLYEEHVLGRNFCPNCGCAMKGGEEE